MKSLKLFLTIVYILLFISFLYSILTIDRREILELVLSIYFLLFISITNYIEIPVLIKSDSLDISAYQRRGIRIANLLSLLVVALYIPFFSVVYLYEHPAISKILSSVNLLLMLYVIVIEFKALKSHYWQHSSK